MSVLMVPAIFWLCFLPVARKSQKCQRWKQRLDKDYIKLDDKDWLDGEQCRLQIIYDNDPVKTQKLSVVGKQAIASMLQAHAAQGAAQNALQTLPPELQSQLNTLIHSWCRAVKAPQLAKWSRNWYLRNLNTCKWIDGTQHWFGKNLNLDSYCSPVMNMCVVLRCLALLQAERYLIRTVICYFGPPIRLKLEEASYNISDQMRFWPNITYGLLGTSRKITIQDRVVSQRQSWGSTWLIILHLLHIPKHRKALTRTNLGKALPYFKHTRDTQVELQG